VAIFTPPIRSYDPPIAADTPEWQKKPAIWNRSGLIPRGVNVFKLTDGTYTEQQPFTNAPFTSGWELVAFVYYGGHSYEISDAEAALLIAAGYGANIDQYNNPDTYLAAYR